MNNHLKSILIKKGIEYEDLKSALVPSTNKNEIAFVFDSSLTSSLCYGKEIMDYILPLLVVDTTQSILHGSWIGRKEHINLPEKIRNSIFGKNERFVGEMDNLYFVYINNLSDRMVFDLNKKLVETRAYAGYLEMNHKSYIKEYISTIMVSMCIKYKRMILQPHEDDESEDENLNMIGYNFEDFGYEIKSIQSYLYDVFLTYKIESSVFDPKAIDTRFSLNAISEDPMFLNEMEIQIEDKKLHYLKEKKAGSLKRADLFELPSKAIAEKIKEKICSNYIYNLSRSKCGTIMKFDLIIENASSCKTVCALEYIPKEKELRLITLY